MFYDEGDILEFRSFVFEDGSEDGKISRPAFLPLAVDIEDEYIYCLSLTSKTNKYFEKPQFQDQYYLIKRSPDNGLKKSSLVNLRTIYKRDFSRERQIAFIRDDTYRKLIRKFKRYQSRNPSEYYDEIESRL